MSIGTPYVQSPCSLTSRLFAPYECADKKIRSDRYDPPPFEENPAKQEALCCTSLRDPLRQSILESQRGRESWRTKSPLLVSSDEFSHLSCKVTLIKSYKEAIKSHLATRVALFFQQLVLCYQTPFEFVIAPTEGQFFSAPTLKVHCRSGYPQTLSIDYQAAHSSTIPALLARVRSEFFPPDQNWFYFLKSSHYDHLNQSTNALPKEVNQLDSAIDGNSKVREGLRQASIVLINQVARASLDPIQATREFLRVLSERLECINGKKPSQVTEKVIQFYQAQLNDIIVQANIPMQTTQTHPLFDRLLTHDCRLMQTEDVPIIRSIVYQEKYNIIREAQFAESLIQQQIDSAFPDHKTMSKKHEVRLALVYYACNSWSVDQPTAQALEKLFHISYALLLKDQNVINKAHQFCVSNTIAIENLLRGIRLTIRNFKQMKHCFTSKLIKRFRVNLRGLRQIDLAERVSQVISTKIFEEQQKVDCDQGRMTLLKKMPTSQSTISRLENDRIHIDYAKTFLTPENQRRKILPFGYAIVLAEALNIPSGLFFCSFFT